MQVNGEWKCKTIDSKEMWHKTKNIKKNFEIMVESQTPLRKPKNDNSFASDNRLQNGEARKLLLALGPSLKRHFYRCCKTARGKYMKSG